MTVTIALLFLLQVWNPDMTCQAVATRCEDFAWVAEFTNRMGGPAEKFKVFARYAGKEIEISIHQVFSNALYPLSHFDWDRDRDIDLHDWYIYMNELSLRGRADVN